MTVNVSIIVLPAFMKPKGPLACLQMPTIGPNPKPIESIALHNILFLVIYYSIILVSTHTFPKWCFCVKFLYAFFYVLYVRYVSFFLKILICWSDAHVKWMEILCVIQINVITFCFIIYLLKVTSMPTKSVWNQKRTCFI